MATLMTSNFMLSDDKYGITVKTLHRHITIISLFSLSIHNVTQPLPVYSQYRCSCPFVYLESTSYYGVFSDNGFLMLPDKPLTVSFTSYQVMDEKMFESGLTLR